MLRLVHTADVHLGARHSDLGEVAAAQRERQFAAFQASIDLALAEKVDLFLIAGDLFDSNVQPRRSVERVGHELGRLAEARIRTVITPGTHDLYDRSSVYRAYDFAALANTRAEDGFVTVLTPGRPTVHIASCDVVVGGAVYPTKRAPRSPLEDLDLGEGKEATWKIGLLHSAVAIPGKTDGDEVVVTTEQIAASELDYLALGHWHSAQVAKAGDVTYAYPGAPEPVAIDQDRAGKALLVTLDQKGSKKKVTAEQRTVGRTWFERVDLDARNVSSQAALIDQLRKRGDADLVLDARLTGVRPDSLDLNVDEIERALQPSFLRVRVRDLSLPALTDGVLPPSETIAGAFIRDLEGRIAELEAVGDPAKTAEAAELRDALRLGRLLLAGHEVVP